MYSYNTLQYNDAFLYKLTELYGVTIDFFPSNLHIHTKRFLLYRKHFPIKQKKTTVIYSGPYFLSQTDICNPLCYLLITRLAAIAIYQKDLVPILIQASPHPPLIALNNRSEGTCLIMLNSSNINHFSNTMFLCLKTSNQCSCRI